MGFLDRLIGGSSDKGDDSGTQSLDNCPYCGNELTGWECWRCKVEFVFEDGKLVEEMLSKRGPRGGQGDCVYCQSSLSGGQSYMPYEDGSNPEAYIICPSCGEQNIREGMGGD